MKPVQKVQEDYRYPRRSAGGQTDKNTYDIQQVDRGLQAKVDTRNTVDYTFTKTGSATFRHGLGRTPVGGTVVRRDKQASIYYLSGTDIDVTMTSDTANVTATILLL